MLHLKLADHQKTGRPGGLSTVSDIFWRQKVKSLIKVTLGLAGLAALIYCIALFGFGVRLDYKLRIALCQGDTVCEAKVWAKDKWNNLKK